MELANKLFSKLFGKKVGEDEFGNTFYESKKLSRYFSRYMRWVIYNGIPEATKVNVDWYCWLNHQENQPPSSNTSVIYQWIKPRNLNLTGSKFRYLPPSMHLSNKKSKLQSSADYTAWKPKQ